MLLPVGRVPHNGGGTRVCEDIEFAESTCAREPGSRLLQDGRLDVAVSAGRCRESLQMLFPGYVDMDHEFRVHPIDVVPATMLLCWRMYDFNKRLAFRRYMFPNAEDR